MTAKISPSAASSESFFLFSESTLNLSSLQIHKVHPAHPQAAGTVSAECTSMPGTGHVSYGVPERQEDSLVFMAFTFWPDQKHHLYSSSSALFPA